MNISKCVYLCRRSPFRQILHLRKQFISQLKIREYLLNRSPLSSLTDESLLFESPQPPASLESPQPESAIFFFKLFLASYS